MKIASIAVSESNQKLGLWAFQVIRWVGTQLQSWHRKIDRGGFMNSLKVLENSLFWQKVVFKESKNPIQKARVSKNIEKLTAQIAALTKGE